LPKEFGVIVRIRSDINCQYQTANR